MARTCRLQQVTGLLDFVPTTRPGSSTFYVALTPIRRSQGVGRTTKTLYSAFELVMLVGRRENVWPQLSRHAARLAVRCLD